VTPFIGKMAWSILTGFVAFAGSALLDNVLRVSLADQLVLTFITGGVTLLVQYLAEFEQRLRDVRDTVQRGFAGVSEATTLMDDIERSALRKESLKNVIRRAGHVTSTTRPLVRAVADSEIERLSETLQALADGHEYFYDGEDRELLLALARNAQTSIIATSWATESANGAGFEAGFWLTDLGGRYLDLQRSALRRGVSIRRIFIYDSPDLITSDELTRILAMQHSAGVEVRLLGGGPLPPSGAIADFVIFDEEISYDTTPVTRGGGAAAPWLLNTRLVFNEEIVRNRTIRFQELWEAAALPQRTADRHI
jgi:hypothetical protein